MIPISNWKCATCISGTLKTHRARNLLFYRSGQEKSSMKNLKGEPVLSKETVRVYRNLRDKCWSIQRKTKKGWRVWLRWDYVVLDDVTFAVNHSGRERVRREHKKYVHAYAYGTLMANTLGCEDHMLRVHYNPHTQECFETRHGEVHNAKRVWLTHNGEVFCE